MAVRFSVLRADLPPFTPPPQEDFVVLVPVRGSVDSGIIPQLEGLGQLRHSINSSGIEAATICLVV
jgi:hypothetical protein